MHEMSCLPWGVEGSRDRGIGRGRGREIERERAGRREGEREGQREEVRPCPLLPPVAANSCQSVAFPPDGSPAKLSTLSPAPCTLHPTPYTLHPAFETLKPDPIPPVGATVDARAKARREGKTVSALKQ